MSDGGHDVLDGADQAARIQLVLQGLADGLCELKPAGNTAVMIVKRGGARIYLLEEDVTKMLSEGLIAFDGKTS
jgi:hypothetical protein